ncbi:sorting nexin-20 [Cimex lectularius]|uniref:PX domain-containing protein n=1 Tax=Cimex lectularius TaxID=79782 RepID=A0A8I6RU70_CIMLE|nr:sorting nexin-20 [Cimex lectularius]XP_014248148.1 sorting nexin-20 [Cimex lectularius]
MATLNEINFKIISVNVSTVELGKKAFLIYSIKVSSEAKDPQPVVIKRRYTDFLVLFNSLKNDFPDLTESVQFPRKAIFGNFSKDVINERKEGFQKFLEVIGTTSQLRISPAVTNFMQYRELSNAVKLIEQNNLEQAVPLVENCFWVMNKVQTARAPAVLRNLCLMVCLSNSVNSGYALNFADLAVRRFQTVSDIDLLRYYVPLLNISLDLCQKYGKDSTEIAEYLVRLKRRGMALHNSTPLLQLIMQDITPYYK